MRWPAGRPAPWSWFWLASFLIPAVACAPAGERYRLAPAAEITADPAGEAAFEEIQLPGGRIVRPAPADLVYARMPSGTYYAAFNGCGAARDDMFYEGFARGRALLLQPLGRYPEATPYCAFGLASDGDSLVVWGGSNRQGVSWLKPRLHAQLLLLDPEHGTARRLSPPRGFTRRVERVWFSSAAGTYLLRDHRGKSWRIRLP